MRRTRFASSSATRRLRCWYAPWLRRRAHLTAMSAEQKSLQVKLEDAGRADLSRLRDTSVDGIDAAPSPNGWAVREPTAGARAPSPADIGAIEKHLSEDRKDGGFALGLGIGRAHRDQRGLRVGARPHSRGTAAAPLGRKSTEVSSHGCGEASGFFTGGFVFCLIVAPPI
jgi:hypothetical protein